MAQGRRTNMSAVMLVTASLLRRAGGWSALGGDETALESRKGLRDMLLGRAFAADPLGKVGESFVCANQPWRCTGSPSQIRSDQIGLDG